MPHIRFFQSRGLALGRVIPQASGVDHRNYAGTGTPVLTVCIPGFMHTRNWKKSIDFRGAWARPICWSWRVSQWGRSSYDSLWGTRTQVEIILGNIRSVNPPAGCHFDSKIWWQKASSVLECLRPSNQQSSTTAPPIRNRLPKIFLSPQPPLNELLNTALPIRGHDPAPSTSGQAWVHPTRKPLQKTLRSASLPTHWEQT